MEDSPFRKDGMKNEAKLNLIASLLFDIKQSLGEKISVKDKIDYLLKRGITNDDDISIILGIKRSHASKEKAIIKREQSKENGREETI